MARRQLHDQFFKQAKGEGYLARSAYKLKQIQAAKRPIKPADRVLDLGCAPGAWLQVAGELVGAKGRVVGLDLKPCRHPFPAHITHLVGDVFEVSPQTLTAEAGGMFDVVLSDMAPNTTGHGDSERSATLCRRILEILPGLLKPTGHLAMKVLEGGEYPPLLQETKGVFADVKGYKPPASRAVSREMYIVAKGYAQT